MSPFNQKHSRDDEAEESVSSGRIGSAKAQVNEVSSERAPVQQRACAPKSQQKRLRRRGTENKQSKERHSSSTSNSRSTPAIASYIPPYLRPYIHPYYGDFTFSRYFDASLIVQLMAEGFLPMCANEQILLPKLHEERSCILLQPQSHTLTQPQHDQSQGNLHISKSTRKRAKKYQLTFNRDWNRVIEGCRAQHGTHCWLYDPLVESYKVIHERTKEQSAASLSIDDNGRKVLMNSDEDGVHKATMWTTQGKRQIPVRMYSVELWAVDPPTNEQTPKNESASKTVPSTTTNTQEKQQVLSPSPPRLVAGELGYTVGAVYTSLTGYSNESSAGSVQMAALGSALQQAGFAVWDLGMDMDYKQDLGARLVERDDFLQLVHTHRVSRDCILLQHDATPQNARVLIDSKP